VSVLAHGEDGGLVKLTINSAVELQRKEGCMPDFKQLAEGQKPADAERCILIEVIHEPAIGKQYTVTGKGIEPNDQMHTHTRYRTLEEVRERALEWAQAVDVPIIYLTSDIVLTEP
jgi:hypothetical protein